MLIGVRKRFVFVANTKTASTSIDAALLKHAEITRAGNSERKHMRLALVPAEYNFLFDNPRYPFNSFFKFGVMREPISWINSWYRYRRGNRVDSPLPPEMSFEKFWLTRDWNTIRGTGEKYLQRDFFTDAAGNPLADVIIPYERIKDYIPAIFSALKINHTLPQLNVSKLREAPLDVSPDFLAQMRDFYAADFALYNRLDEINAVGMEKLRMMSEGK